MGLKVWALSILCKIGTFNSFSFLPLVSIAVHNIAYIIKRHIRTLQVPYVLCVLVIIATTRSPKKSRSLVPAPPKKSRFWFVEMYTLNVQSHYEIFGKCWYTLRIDPIVEHFWTSSWTKTKVYKTSSWKHWKSSDLIKRSKTTAAGKLHLLRYIPVKMYSVLYCTIVLSISCISSGIIVRYYNDVDRQDFQNYTDFSAAFLTNHDSAGSQKTNVNILLGVYEPQVSNRWNLAERLTSSHEIQWSDSFSDTVMSTAFIHVSLFETLNISSMNNNVASLHSQIEIRFMHLAGN